MNYGYNHGSQGDLLGLSSTPRREVSRDDLKTLASLAPAGTGEVRFTFLLYFLFVAVNSFNH